MGLSTCIATVLPGMTGAWKSELLAYSCASAEVWGKHLYAPQTDKKRFEASCIDADPGNSTPAFVTAGAKRISLEQLRKVLGLESIRDAQGNIIRRAPLPVWANFRQRALDTAISGINAKTDLHIQLESLERSAHRRVTAVTFAIKAQGVRNDGVLVARKP